MSAEGETSDIPPAAAAAAAAFVSLQEIWDNEQERERERERERVWIPTRDNLSFAILSGHLN